MTFLYEHLYSNKTKTLINQGFYIPYIMPPISLNNYMNTLQSLTLLKKESVMSFSNIDYISSIIFQGLRHGTERTARLSSVVPQCLDYSLPVDIAQRDTLSPVFLAGQHRGQARLQ